MKRFKRLPSPSFATATLTLLLAASASAADNPFVGNWALALPSGGAGWLGVTQEKNYLDASMLWGGGSVTPLDSAFMADGTFVFTRIRIQQRKDDNGKVVRSHTLTKLVLLPCQDGAPRDAYTGFVNVNTGATRSGVSSVKSV